MTSQTRSGVHAPRHLWAVAAAVYVAVTHDLDHPGGGDHPVDQISDEAALKAYVESYLDGYAVTPESLSAAMDEGSSLTEGTLKELISQAAAADLDVEEFFADVELDLEGGLAAAASFAAATGATAGTRESSVRDQVFATWQRADDQGTLVLVRPGEVWSSFGIHEVARGHILARSLPATTPYIGWGGDRDVLRPDGTFKKGEDRQEVLWHGDAEMIGDLLRQVEPLGYAIEGGANRTRFRLVSDDDPSSSEPYALPQRDDLLGDQDALAPGALRFAASWVEKAHGPKGPGDHLTESEARGLYEAGSSTDFFVFPEAPEGVAPAWSMKVRPSKKTVVVTHYHHPSGSVARIMAFTYTRVFTNSVPGGSLWRDTVTDYLWPADHVRYAPKTRATHTVTLRDLADASEIVRADRASGEKTVTKHRDGSTGQLLVSYPPFGEWEPILDPRFGEAEDPYLVPRLSIDAAWDARRREVWGDDAVDPASGGPQ